MKMSDVFFIIGFVRSGTTAFAKILDTASNAEVFVEHSPKLLIESRELLKGNLPDPISILWSAKHPHISKVVNRKLKYGDKNIAYMPFIPYIITLWDCKIVFLIRDGRDAVRSLIDWHDYKAHNIYTMQEDGEKSGAVLPEKDPWDYSRLRPNLGDPLFKRWKTLNRFQKCAWYWANFNRMALDNLAKIDRKRWMMVDVSNNNVDVVKQIFDFLCLKDFDPKHIKSMLNLRINSLLDRTGRTNRLPQWQDWTHEQTQSFEELAGSMMSRLGYW